MTAVYNEIDPFAAATLRELVKAGHIAPGEVWENDIRDIRPADLRGVIQFHAFAGFGVWSYAARLAGWHDRRPLWTASCPCQPFSAAGAGAGFADERHLWPHYHHLVRECGPPVVVGEQVASKDADPWIDLVQDDMEALDYAFGAVPFPSASVGAPHIRDRTYWVANAEGHGHERSRKFGQQARRDGAAHGGAVDGMDDDDDARLEGQRGRYQTALGYGQGEVRPAAETGEFGGLEHADGRDASAERQQPVGQQRFQPEDGSALRQAGGGSWSGFAGSMGRPSPTNGFWRDPDWLYCRDGKWRPVEPGTFPLAHGAAARVGRLRGYGNAINAQQARIFLEEVQEIISPAIDHAAGHLRLGVFG